MNVPFVNLKLTHQKLKNQIIGCIEEIIEQANFVGGNNVLSLEKEFSEYCGSKYSVAVNSGTDALRFVFLHQKNKTPFEMITVPNTFIATTEAISQSGGEIVFVDVDKNTHQMDPLKLEQKVKRSNKNRIKIVVPVHLFGHLADMDPILEIAKRYELIVIEDACQAHGAIYKGSRKAGSMGLAGCFSFYPGKNLGACGEGGAVVTNDKKVDQTVRMLRDHGQSQKYYHEIEGYNGRLDAIQAGILRIKLKYLDEWNQARRRNAKLYDKLLQDVEEVEVVPEPSWSTSVYHLYVIKVKNRDTMQKKLAEKGIGTALHYPVPLHLQNAYKHLGYKDGDFPIAEKHAKEILSLPMFPELTEEQIVYVVDSIKECLKQ